MRLALIAILPLAFVACSSNTSPTGDAAPSDGTTSVDSSNPADTGSGMDSGIMDAQPVKDASGPPDSYAPTAAAAYFCQGFQQICGFNKNGWYKDLLSCEWAYDNYSTNTEMCVGNALGAMDCAGAACTGATCMPCN